MDIGKTVTVVQSEPISYVTGNKTLEDLLAETAKDIEFIVLPREERIIPLRKIEAYNTGGITIEELIGVGNGS